MNLNDDVRKCCAELGIAFEIARGGRTYEWAQRIHQSQVVEGIDSTDLTTPATASPYHGAILEKTDVPGMFDVYKPA